MANVDNKCKDLTVRDYFSENGYNDSKNSLEDLYSLQAKTQSMYFEKQGKKPFCRCVHTSTRTHTHAYILLASSDVDCLFKFSFGMTRALACALFSSAIGWIVNKEQQRTNRIILPEDQLVCNPRPFCCVEEPKE